MNILKQNKKYNEKRRKANQELIEFIYAYINKYPYLRFGQIVAALKLDDFNEEPWVMLERIKKENEQ